jgi:hypothetical protein
MAEKKFRFVSPGIFINEVDNSQLPNDLPDVGPIIIGRAEYGPAMRPIRINSPSEFVEFYGNPIAGGRGDDVWRDGNYVGPTYGAYAAMAYLRAGVGPVNYVRLLGADTATATGNGQAGWGTGGGASNEMATNKTALGLFLFNSSSATMYDNDIGTGNLAAVFYTNGATVGLVGKNGGTASDEGVLGLIESSGDGLEFTAAVSGSDNTQYKTSFNFDRNSSKYIRKVFNTNPQLVQSGRGATHTKASDIRNLADKYFLGETFERFATLSTTEGGNIANTSAGKVYGIIVPLGKTTSEADNFGYKRRGFEDGQTGFVFSQDTSTTSTGFDAVSRTQPLFKIKALNHAEWASKNLKVSISDIRAARNDIDGYGTFTVEVRMAGDSDNVPEIIEQFTGCNLNPASEDYIAKKIGDKYLEWRESERRLVQRGEFNNQSKYVYIEMNQLVADGLAPQSLVPFGFFGPVKPKNFSVFSGSVHTFLSGAGVNTTSTKITTFATGTFAVTGGYGVSSPAVGGAFMQQIADGSGNEFTASFAFPSLSLREKASDGGMSDPTRAYFGIQTTITKDSIRFDPGYADYVRGAPGSAGVFTTGSSFEYSFVFTLDDVKSGGEYVSGSRLAGTSISAVNSSHKNTLDSGYNRFTMPLWGGHDGVDISEQEPFNNVAIGSTANQDTSYAYNTVKRAIDTVADPEFVEANILSVPGVTQPIVTDHVLSVAEGRADCLAVIDIQNVYDPSTESTNTFADRVGSVSSAVSSLEQRRINSSYGCTFYPWVRIRDDISNASLWVPPSVIAIGTFASSEARAELWFAPAGFTRGGLSTGAGGFPVLSTTERLRREDRDDLYEVNVNPIATFPSEGIVVFGQKTLQVTPSALDRINVRRLLIFLKKRISRIAASILFDQNVRTTWTRFKAEADKFLGSVQARLGLSEFRVLLDETTTTPDLVDRNILYAKIFLKPARSIEFIAIDFVITRSGASFDD